MTTTPDSRIAHDWNPDGTPYDTADRHLGPMTHRPAASPNFIFAREDFMQKLASAISDPIDTSTTAGKVAVMQHAETHGASSIEFRKKSSYNPDRYSRLTCDTPDILWNWELFDYRITPPPAPRTALQAARDHVLNWTGAHNPDILRLEPLLREIDSCKTVNIVWDGKGIYNFQHEGITPGRYRLVRDDA